MSMYVMNDREGRGGMGLDLRQRGGGRARISGKEGERRTVTRVRLRSEKGGGERREHCEAGEPVLAVRYALLSSAGHAAAL